MSCIATAAAAAAASASSQLQPALATKTLKDLVRSNSSSVWKLKLYKAPSDHFDSLAEFMEAVEINTSITAVDITWRFLRQLEDPIRIQLMGKIGALPNLEEIAMEVAGPTSVLTTALQNSTSKLKSLKIGKLRFSSNRDVVELADALKQCKSLKQISLSSFHLMVLGNHVLDNEGMVWFMENQNSEEQIITLDPLLNAIASLPQLEHVRFQHYLNGSSNFRPPSEQSLRALCHKPRHSLIFNSCGLTDDQCFAISDELKCNDLPLSILVVTRNTDISPLGWDAFGDMLKVNYNIVDFHSGEDSEINAPSPEQLAQIAYYLRLNLAGRKRLLRGPMCARREAWLDFLVRGKDDLDMVFFALQADPSLYITPSVV